MRERLYATVLTQHFEYIHNIIYIINRAHPEENGYTVATVLTQQTKRNTTEARAINRPQTAGDCWAAHIGATDITEDNTHTRTWKVSADADVDGAPIANGSSEPSCVRAVTE